MKESLQRRLIANGTIAVHWLGNFARNFARQGICFCLSMSVGIYLDRDAFVSMLWTANGVEIWPWPAPVAMTYRYAGEDVVRAMPRLSFLLRPGG